mgnify:CR=1 FL=1
MLTPLVQKRQYHRTNETSRVQGEAQNSWQLKETLPGGRAKLQINKLKKDTTNHKTDSGAIIEKQ